MESDYASVTDQAGVYAGDGGFVINTAETTSLEGAVIDSTVDSNESTSGFNCNNNTANSRFLNRIQ